MRKYLPRWLRIYYDLCFSDEADDQVFDPEEFDMDGEYPMLDKDCLHLAECVLNQVLCLMEDEEYLKGHTHQASHLVTDSETGDVKSTPCEQHTYPDDELEYLAVRAFNQALDYFAEGKDEDCKRWASKSIRLAEGMGDQKGASLAEDFRGRLKTCLS